MTLEAATSEMLLYVVYNLLNTFRYGAKETRTGRNVQNNIIGTVTAEHDASLSTGELLMDYHEGGNIADSIEKYVTEVSQDGWNFSFGDLPEWLQRMQEIVTREAEDAEKIMADAFESLTDEAREELLNE